MRSILLPAARQNMTDLILSQAIPQQNEYPNIGFEYFYKNNNNTQPFICEALNEFFHRNIETKAFMMNKMLYLENVLLVSRMIHYDDENNIKESPHFNVKTKAGTLHVFLTKNCERITRITEMNIYAFPF